MTYRHSPVRFLSFEWHGSLVTSTAAVHVFSWLYWRTDSVVAEDKWMLENKQLEICNIIPPTRILNFHLCVGLPNWKWQNEWEMGRENGWSNKSTFFDTRKAIFNINEKWCPCHTVCYTCDIYLPYNPHRLAYNFRNILTNLFSFEMHWRIIKVKCLLSTYEEMRKKQTPQGLTNNISKTYYSKPESRPTPTINVI